MYRQKHEHTSKNKEEDIKMTNIAKKSGFEHWLGEEKNSRGWYTCEITGKNFRGEKAQEMLEAQKAFVESHGAPVSFEAGEVDASDILMWVGHQGYNDIAKFVDEANRLGISKRISRIPKGIIPGKTRVFLAHDEGIKGDAVIFGYFVVDHAEKLVYEENELGDMPEFVKPVLLNSAYLEEERVCGMRTEVDALYLRGSMVEFEEYKDYNELIDENATRFRSYKNVDGDYIINSTVIKSAPSGRAGRTINIPVDKLPKANSKWTDLEINELERLVSERGKLYPAFKEFARQTNRSMRSIEYRWFNSRKKEEGDEDGNV